jgi:hypothetical protein
MEEPHESARTRTPAHSNAAPPRALSPLKVFALLLGGLALAFAAITGFRSESKEEPIRAQPQQTSDEFALTDAEAIEKFEELNELQLQVGRMRDLSLVSRVFVPGSPIAGRASQSVRKMLKHNVIDDLQIETLRLQVISNTPAQLVIRETSVEYPCIRTESGDDVTRGPTAIREVIDWTLVKRTSEWRLYDAAMKRHRALEEHGDHCE